MRTSVDGRWGIWTVTANMVSTVSDPSDTSEVSRFWAADASSMMVLMVEATATWLWEMISPTVITTTRCRYDYAWHHRSRYWASSESRERKKRGNTSAKRTPLTLRKSRAEKIAIALAPGLRWQQPSRHQGASRRNRRFGWRAGGSAMIGRRHRLRCA